MHPEDAMGGLAVAMAGGLVLSVAGLLVVYKMIDGDLPFVPGLVALFLVLASLTECAAPVNPVIPGAILVVTLTLLAFFPYGISMMEKAELQAYDTSRLERAYRALAERPDNVAAQFELARGLHRHGMRSHAIAVASAALHGLSTQVDPLKNSSLRDAFRSEDYMVRSWQREQAEGKPSVDPLKCPACGTVMKVGEPVCTGCKRPYLLDLALNLDIRPKIFGKMVLAWAALAAFLVTTTTLAVSFSGLVMAGMFSVALAVVAFFIAWLFRPRKLVA